MSDFIHDIFKSCLESNKVKTLTIEKNYYKIEDVSLQIARRIFFGSKIFLFGNGGSAADCQHIAAEFVGKFGEDRQSLPAIALTTDTSILTAVGNDYGYDKIFSRQIQGLASSGDVGIGISTSGDSRNVLLGIKECQKKNMYTFGLTGNDNPTMGAPNFMDCCIEVESKETPRIQETHILIGHIICEIVEEILFRDGYNG